MWLKFKSLNKFIFFEIVLRKIPLFLKLYGACETDMLLSITVFVGDKLNLFPRPVFYLCAGRFLSSAGRRYHSRTIPRLAGGQSMASKIGAGHAGRWLSCRLH